MSHVEAVYRHGVFQPLETVSLREEQRVQLHFEPVVLPTASEWLDEIRAIQNEILRRGGALPDTSTEIATDRSR